MIFIQIITVALSLIVTCLGLSSQIYKNYKRKSTEGLSLFYFVLLAISYSFWTLYGFLLKDVVIIVPMILGSVASFSLVVQFILYKK